MMTAVTSKTSTKTIANSMKKSKLTQPQEVHLDNSEDANELNMEGISDEDGSMAESYSADASDEEENSGSDDVGENESADEENESDDEENESDDEENESNDDMESESEDDNAEGEDWMDVDDHDEDEDNDQSSSDDETSEGVEHTEVESGDPKLHGNAGWADAMAKILRTSKPKGKKSIVLAKAKKLSQVTTSQTPDDKEDYGFEIDGEVEDKDIKPKLEELDLKPDLVKLKGKIRRRAQLAEGKVKPSILHRERERALSKIATKGVVQLFNAVREQQKDISSKLKEANGSLRKEEKILKSIDKRAFLDVLMGKAQSERVEDNVRINKQEIKTEETEKPATWNVLRENFLTGTNLKDWDKCGEIKLESDIDEVELN